MLTSKQRSYLRKLSNGYPALLSVGKAGITPEFTASVSEALAARELVKISVLNNSPEEAHEAAETIGGRTRSDVVSVVGRKITLYKRAKEKPVIELPKS